MSAYQPPCAEPHGDWSVDHLSWSGRHLVAAEPVEVLLQHGAEAESVTLEPGTVVEDVGRAFDLPRMIGYDLLFIRSGSQAGRCALTAAHSDALGIPPGWSEPQATS